ncbi:MAG TPA: helix-hairpin-helix domain-containing protein [Ktedonobacterales bacterium]|jgi:DNA polymerase (family 10)|nr:helix-hairpin-helix domain-containing protein [Ktedonobacterales bacterium]
MFQFTQSVQFTADPGEQEALPIRVSNQKIAEVLFNIATLLDMQQANPYRIAAYRRAARGLLTLGEPASQIIARGEKLTFAGLGERLRRKITEFITTGRMTFYDDLVESSLPEDVRDLMRVAYVGPRTALRLSGQFDIHTVAQLFDAATNHKLRDAYGFGPRSEARLAEGAHALLAGHPIAA